MTQYQHTTPDAEETEEALERAMQEIARLRTVASAAHILRIWASHAHMWQGKVSHAQWSALGQAIERLDKALQEVEEKGVR